MKVTIQQSDLGFTANGDGYMLMYQGKPIGGAGVRLPRERRLSPQQRAANLRDFRASAERDIASLVTGHGSQHYLGAITKIAEEIQH